MEMWCEALYTMLCIGDDCQMGRASRCTVAFGKLLAMEEIGMWNIVEEKNFKIYESEICSLKMYYQDEYLNVFVNYKGYNILMPMGMWGFEDEIQERGIDYKIGGEKGKFKTFFYIVKEQDLKLFCDLIYFFLSENNMDGVLNDSFRMEIE